VSGGSYLALLGGFLVLLGIAGGWRMRRLLATSKEDRSLGILETIDRGKDRRDQAFIGYLNQRIMYAAAPAYVVLGLLLLLAGLMQK
jgi:hypothetical protein